MTKAAFDKIHGGLLEVLDTVRAGTAALYPEARIPGTPMPTDAANITAKPRPKMYVCEMVSDKRDELGAFDYIEIQYGHKKFTIRIKDIDYGDHHLVISGDDRLTIHPIAANWIEVAL